MTTEQTHHTNQSKTNPRIWEVTITIHDRLQPHDNIPFSQICADNLNQIRLILQFLTGLEVETRVTIYLTTRNSQLPTTVTSLT